MADPLVIVGAGNAGVSLAARLVRDGRDDVVVVDPRARHRYRPLLSYVAAGMADIAPFTRNTADVVPDGCSLVDEEVTACDPVRHTVTLDSGREIAWSTLVIATGLLEDRPAIDGLSEAYAAGWAASSFVDETASLVWEKARALTAGTVVFTLPPEPAPCAATGLKPLFMLGEHWAERGVLTSLDVHLVVPGDTLVPLADATTNRRLESRLADLGVTVHRRAHVGSVDHATRRVSISSADGDPTVLEDVTLPHVIPHYRAPAWIAAAGLGSGHAGQVHVDERTLRHVTHNEVWSLGDVADLGTPPSGGALRHQVDVLSTNLAASTPDQLTGYDGYTVMPVTLDRRTLSLVEVDRHGTPAPTTGLVDLTKPRRSTWLFDRHGLPRLYYGRILRGKV